MSLANFPMVTLITPTYNRRLFIPHLIRIVEQQTYPRNRMEWIILDDGQDLVGDLFEEAKDRLPTLKYIQKEEKMSIGEKRNYLNNEATSDIIIAMDDDDFYFPERVSSVVHAFRSKPSVDLAGSTEIYMFFSDTKDIYKCGPYGANHATNGTMAWRKRYSDTHQYDETVAFAEEKSFLDGYKNPLIQLNPMKVMLVISHSDNTFDKKSLREANNPLIKKTTMRIKDFIKDPSLRAFFETLP